MTSLFMPSKSYAINGTTTEEVSSGGSGVVLTGEVGVYLATFAALLTAKIIDEGRKIVGQKDFARNLGMKFVEFGRGIKFACHKPDQIKQMLSDQMTQDMRRILEAAMNQGLKRQAYDGDESRKITPGYFGPGNEFFAWQNVFPSTLVKDEKAPGLLIYIPADRDDFVREDELTSIDDRKTNSQHQRIIKKLLNQILPPEDKRSPLLKSSLETLGRIFTSGAFRVASYYGGGERKIKELKKVPNGVQVLRILNPSDREGRCIDLLGTLIHFPDLGQRAEDKVDIMHPLLPKPASVTETEWKKTLPNRVRWFLKEKQSAFLSGSRKIEQGRFAGPITYSYPERESETLTDKQIHLENKIRKLEQERWAIEVTKDEEMAMIHEAHRIQLEALQRVLDQRRPRRGRLEWSRALSPESVAEPYESFRISPSSERQAHSLTRAASSQTIVQTMTEGSPMLSRRRSKSLSDMRLQTACEYPSRMVSPESLANGEQYWASRSPSPFTGSSPVARAASFRRTNHSCHDLSMMREPSPWQAVDESMTAAMPHDWASYSDRFCEQMLAEDIDFASHEAAACHRSSQQAAEMALESERVARGIAEDRPGSPGYSDIDFSDDELEEYPLGNAGSPGSLTEGELASVLVS